MAHATARWGGRLRVLDAHLARDLKAQATRTAKRPKLRFEALFLLIRARVGSAALVRHKCGT
eukprot:1051366-Alexandrium_andersonii.AAC.1